MGRTDKWKAPLEVAKWKEDVEREILKKYQLWSWS